MRMGKLNFSDNDQSDFIEIETTLRSLIDLLYVAPGRLFIDTNDFTVAISFELFQANQVFQ